MMISGSTENGRRVINQILSNASQDTFPSMDDLNGAADALLRLQDTYKLKTSSLARGQIDIHPAIKPMNGKPHQVLQLSAGDCFELGRHSYVNSDHYHTLLWMQEALERYEQETVKTVDKAEILEYLAFSNFQQGNVKLALKLTNELLQLNPNHPRAYGNAQYYQNMLIPSGKSKLRGDSGDDVPVDDFISSEKTRPKKREDSERELYESLCRGESYISPKAASELYCHYLDTQNRSYLRYMRIKVEIIFKKPYLVVFHDIMSENEIEVIKQLAYPKLKRATVQNSKTGELEVAQYRISKSAWLKDSDHEVIERVNRRIEAISGLTVQTAEDLQVVNYGIGGHYEPHFDFARKDEKNAFKSLKTGNRIATWLNYMSDVEAGGATAFPALGVAVWPKKGSAAFWYNLHRSGEGDYLTRHAACPVLIGSKWVSNKWFHERGQEVLRPCGLKIND